MTKKRNIKCDSCSRACLSKDEKDEVVKLNTCKQKICGKKRVELCGYFLLARLKDRLTKLNFLAFSMPNLPRSMPYVRRIELSSRSSPAEAAFVLCSQKQGHSPLKLWGGPWMQSKCRQSGREREPLTRFPPSLGTHIQSEQMLSERRMLSKVHGQCRISNIPLCNDE